MGEINNERLIQLSKDPFTILPTVEEAFEISKKFDIPLHPKYSFYWDSINIDEVLLLKEKLCIQKQQNPGFSSNKTSDTYFAFTRLRSKHQRYSGTTRRNSFSQK